MKVGNITMMIPYNPSFIFPPSFTLLETEIKMKHLKSFFGSHMGMMLICCLAMVGAYFLFASGIAEGSILAALAPLIACVGVHFLMMKMTGKSCHGSHEHDKKDDKQQNATPHGIPKTNP
jgi:hypothetical protein